MKIKDTISGVILLVFAAFVLFGGLIGSIPASINWWQIGVSLLLIFLIYSGIRSTNFFMIMFPLAGLYVIFAEELHRYPGIPRIEPWPVFLAALLASFGLPLIFGRHKKEHSHCGDWNDADKPCKVENHTAQETNEYFENETATGRVSFGAGTHYIKSQNFSRGDFDVSFGGLKIYFDDTVLNPSGATLNISSAFSGVELFIPKEWQVKNLLSPFCSGIDEKNIQRQYAVDAPVLTLSGNINFTGVDIYYV